MHITSSRARSRQAGLVFALLTLWIAYGCSDNVVAPNAQSDVRASGVWVSSLWKPGATGLQYVGSATGTAEVILGARTSTAHQSDVREIPLGPIGVESLRLSLKRSPLASSGAQLSPHQSANAQTPKGSVTQAFKTRSLRLKGSGGDNLRLEFVDHPLGGGRPPLAVMILKNDRPVLLNEYTYERDGKGWRAVGSRSSVFDTNGKVSLIADKDLSRVSYGHATATVGSARWFKDGIGGGAARLSQLVQPDALFAGPVEPIDDGCGLLLLTLIEKTAVEAVAVAALAGTIATCATPLTAGCVLLIAAAQGALALTDIALGIAIANYYACQHPTAEPVAGSLGSGGGAGTGVGGDCTLYIVSVS